MCKRIVLALVVLLALSASWGYAAETGDEEYFTLQPEDTIIYDDGPQRAWPFDTLMYWAMRFTPARTCSVLAGLIFPMPPMFAGECSLFVWDNTASDLPGALVRGPIHYTLFLAPWYRIDLPSAYPDSDDFWIGYCTPFVPVVGRVFAMSDTFMDYYTRNCVSWDRTSWNYCDDTIPGWVGDLGIRALVRYYAIHDVGPDSISVPDSIPCDTTISPAAVVCNWGDTAETFRVDIEIDSALIPVYSDFDTVTALPAGACTAVVFGPWTVPHAHGFCYDLTVWTALPGDTNPSNDTLSKQVCLWCPAVHDVGVDLVIEPPDTVACEDAVPVAARVCNYGDTVETFDVEAIIDSGGPPPAYGDTVQVTALDTALCDTVTFASWLVPDTHAVSYTVTVRTLLTDSDPGNDTAWKSTIAWCPPGIEEVLTMPATPSAYGLGQPRPNPAAGFARIAYQLPAKSHVSLRVYDLSGTVVRTLVEAVEESGFRTATWDGRDDRGRQVASGIYFYKLEVLPEEGEAQRLTAARKTVLLR